MTAATISSLSPPLGSLWHHSGCLCRSGSSEWWQWRGDVMLWHLNERAHHSFPHWNHVWSRLCLCRGFICVWSLCSHFCQSFKVHYANVVSDSETILHPIWKSLAVHLSRLCAACAYSSWHYVISLSILVLCRIFIMLSFIEGLNSFFLF